MAEKVSFRQPVYTYDIDYAGHVSNIVYLRWMETARTKLLEAADRPVQDLLREGIVPILAGTSIDYRKPIHLGDTVEVEIWLSSLRGVTARIEVAFLDGRGELYARGWHRGVFLDAATKRPLRIPADLREALAPFLEENKGGKKT